MKKYSKPWLLHHLRNNSASRWLWSYKRLYLMAATRESREHPRSTLPFKTNSWEDLEHFEATERWHDRKAFLEQARHRIDSGISCITLVLDGQLAFVDWARPNSDRAALGYVGQTVIFPPRVSTQFSGYVHPAHRRKGLFHEGMRRVLHHLFENTDTEYAFAAVEHANASALNAHLRIGFDTIAMLETSRFLGRTHHQGQSLVSTFDLSPEPGESGTWRLERKQR